MDFVHHTLLLVQLLELRGILGPRLLPLLCEIGLALLCLALLSLISLLTLISLLSILSLLFL